MEGASTTEQLIGAARSNNESLIESLLKDKSPADVAKVINTTTDPVGNTLLHLAAHHGSLETLDLLLDQEGVEIDPKNRLAGNTPLHSAVEFARGPGNAAIGLQIVNLLIECGAEPSPKNQSGKRPIDIAKLAGLTDVVNSLRGAQYAQEMTQSYAGEADGPVDGPAEGEEGAEGDEGSASDSE